MAESEQQQQQGVVKQYCLEYYQSNKCGRRNCRHYHHSSEYIDVVSINYDHGYVEGTFTSVPLCRFDRRGCCKFGSNCRFRHINNTWNNQYSNSSSSQSQSFAPAPPVAASSAAPTNHPFDNLPSSSTNLPVSQTTSIECLIIQSKEKTCGICFEIVVKKARSDQKFGILPNCTHCYCIKCISKWRKSRQFDNDVIKACPECRIQSDFVCPSKFWVDKKEEKDQLLDNYKRVLSHRDCKYFKKGTGTCPFGNKCFYRHTYPDGRVCDVGPPRQRRAPRGDTTTTNNQDFEVLQQVLLFNLLEDNNSVWAMAVEDDLEELSYYLNDSYDSDFSDYDYLYR